MSSQKSLQWVEEGYNLFSKNGINSINIESIARRINKNKSSFYHYFGDIDFFEAELLKFHIHKAEQFAELAKKCKSIKPELLNLFIEHKTDLLFHKQLRINRHKPAYKKCFETAFEKLDEAMIDNWADFLGLKTQQLFAKTFLHLIAENFLLQITEQTFDYNWLNNYLDDVNSIFKQMSTRPKK
ncbi:MAG: AcrR family transcriptional regulator [Maribacter sp.]|jgi:AcrR family transcriptional regulator